MMHKHHQCWHKDMKRVEYERDVDYSHHGNNDQLVIDATLRVNVMYSTCTEMDLCHAVG